MTVNARKAGETPEEYKLRRSAQNLADKMMKFTNSDKVLWPANKGIYVKRIHGPLLSQS